MVVRNRVCMDCGKSPEDTPENFLNLIMDERRLENCLCESCKQKRIKGKE